MDDRSAHQRLYVALRRELLDVSRGLDPRVWPAQVADAHRVSVTPVREALFRLVGERLATLHADGGFSVAGLNAAGLADLHAWNGHHLLAALHLLPETTVARIVAVSALNEPRDHAAAVEAVERFFSAIGQATGSVEFMVQVDIANDRLRRARFIEDRIFPDTVREFRMIVRRVVSDAKSNVRRRVHAYHRRRAEHAGQLANLLAGR